MTQVPVKKAAFRYMMPCSLVGICRRFGRDDSLHCLGSHKNVLYVTHIQKDDHTAAHRKRPSELRAQIFTQVQMPFPSPVDQTAASQLQSEQ